MTEEILEESNKLESEITDTNYYSVTDSSDKLVDMFAEYFIDMLREETPDGLKNKCRAWYIKKVDNHLEVGWVKTEFLR